MGAWQKEQPFKVLSGDRLFAQLQALAQKAMFAPGEVLFREEEPAHTLWLIQSGWVRLKRRVQSGQTFALDVVSPQRGMCGLSAFFGVHYMATAVAGSAVKAVGLPSELLRPLMHTHGELANAVALRLNQRYHHVAKAYSWAFAPVEQRIIAVLLRLMDDFGPVIPMTRREIAELAGTTVETAIRMTSRLRREQLVSGQRGKIEIRSRADLEKKLWIPENEAGY